MLKFIYKIKYVKEQKILNKKNKGLFAMPDIKIYYKPVIV